MIGPDARAAVQVLRDLCKGTDDDMRRKAFRALKEIDPEAAARVRVWALLEIFKEKEDVARLVAPLALVAIGPASVPALVEALKDNDERVRRGAALALGMIGPRAKTAVPGLLHALKDTDRYVRAAARDALFMIDPEAARKAGVL
jgi:vesicle coat complex subunit